MADKFEREIDEILSKIRDFPERPAPRRRTGNGCARWLTGVQRSLAIRLSRISVSQVMLAAMGLMLLSYFLSPAFEGVWVYGLILGLILFFTAFALSFRSGGTGRRSQPYFRGMPRSYYESPQRPTIDRLREWWRAQRRGRR